MSLCSDTHVDALRCISGASRMAASRRRATVCRMDTIETPPDHRTLPEVLGLPTWLPALLTILLVIACIGFAGVALAVDAYTEHFDRGLRPGPPWWDDDALRFVTLSALLGGVGSTLLWARWRVALVTATVALAVVGGFALTLRLLGLG